jgi:methyl-accepting chemotaxis protein
MMSGPAALSEAPTMIHELHRATDRAMLAACAMLLVVACGIGAVYGGLLAALLVGVPALAVPAALYMAAPGSLAVRLAAGAALMIFAALMIQLGQGLVEMHFTVFVLLAFLLAYCDWRPVVFAAAVIAVHHLGFDLLQQSGVGVYVFPKPMGFQWVLLHAVFVVVEAAVLCFLAIKLGRVLERSELAVDFASHVATGRLDYPFDAHAVADSPMIAALQRMQTQLAQMLKTARTSSTEVSNLSTSLAGSAATITAGLEQQSAVTAAAAATVEQISVSVDSIAGSAQSARESADLSAARADAGAGVIDSAVNSMRSMASAVGEAARVVETLGEKSAAVHDVVRIIKDIAEQTNLLALNAAIEAARAGESGRGFAVVADEVRKLSDQTGRSTGDISRMIDEIISVRTEVNARITVAVGEVDQGLAYAHEAGQAISEIRDRSARTRDSVHQIADALRQQSAASHEMAASVERISAMTEQARASLAQVATGSAQLADTARALDASVARFSAGH